MWTAARIAAFLQDCNDRGFQFDNRPFDGPSRLVRAGLVGETDREGDHALSDDAHAKTRDRRREIPSGNRLSWRFRKKNRRWIGETFRIGETIQVDETRRDGRSRISNRRQEAQLLVSPILASSKP